MHPSCLAAQKADAFCPYNLVLLSDCCVILDPGPIQYDAAVDPEIAMQKIKTHSEVAGQANVCIFPDLNTGNNTYKV